ncbi:hypothetical protein CFF98v445_06020 [Campylobacter fetus subsp. fetus]|jgi:hypothetical protein|uniref:hypothetical protein n=1 Tax=Campylobacter TaxID=194 RepID=UPI00046ACB86|nr:MULTISPECIES: hypothetical protein [Campylobacter]MCZ6134413.1 hypothetical protein [Campylobacter ureolyticus]OCS15099.1 hypothetical protein CFF98v445_06020 [Campylobacter fetus subsp. fetus]
MLSEFLNFLGLDDKKVYKNKPTSKNNADILDNQNTEEYVVEMKSPHFKEEITTEIIIKNDKKIEIKRVKNIEPLSNGKTLVSTKVYKKDITRA